MPCQRRSRLAQRLAHVGGDGAHRPEDVLLPLDVHLPAGDRRAGRAVGCGQRNDRRPSHRRDTPFEHRLQPETLADLLRGVVGHANGRFPAHQLQRRADPFVGDQIE
jgi:hypothetical protein